MIVENGAEVIKVGDSIIDIEEGKNAGCGLSIGITTRAHTLEQLETAKPDYIIHDLIELLPLLDKKKLLLMISASNVAFLFLIL